jgi:ribonucleoside-diphosphate reductase alpha chain
MDAFSIVTSVALQYGVPLETFVEKFTNMRFEPAGMTDDPDLRIATSLVDYIFRRLVVEYVDFETRRDMGVLTVGERTQPTLPGVEEASIPNETVYAELPLDDQPPSASVVTPPSVPPFTPGTHVTRASETVLCHVCGDIMQRAGSCHACPSCGATSGCS